MKKVYIPISVLNLIFLFILINTSYIVIDISYSGMILVSLMSILAFEVINYAIKQNRKLFLIIACVLIVFAALIVFRNYYYFSSLFNDLIKLAITIDKLTAVVAPVEYSLIRPFYILAIPILISFYMILFKLNLGNFVTLTNTLILLLFQALGFKEGTLSALPLYIFLAFINHNLFKLSTSIKKYSKALLLYYLIICIAISSAIYLYMPSKEGKVASIVESKLNLTLNRNWRNVEAFNNDMSSYASIGINTDSVSSLGKKIKMNNKKLALVSGDVPQYLRTKVYYDFSYDRWSNNMPLESIGNYNQLNLSNAINEYGLAKRNMDYNKEKGSNIKTISIQHLSNDFSNVMISPNYITHIAASEGSFINLYSNESYLTGDTNSSYTISYYDYSDTELLENFTETSYKSDIEAPFDYSIYDDSVNKTYSDSLTLSYSPSERVWKLVYDLLISNSLSNIEKVQIIQNYLLSNYTYSLTPNPMSDSSDYIDFFLFKEKKGYCKSFASAAVMLCRAAGIPARYVEGFKVSGSKDSDGNYILRASDAHAWCEVLTSADKGIWSILETTPGYQINSQGNIHNSSIDDEENDSEAVSNNVNRENSNDKEFNPISKSDDTNFILGNFKIDFKKFFRNYKYIILGMILFILAVLFKLLRRSFIIKRVIKSSSLIPLYTFILQRLKTINMNKMAYETDKEFALRVKYILDLEPLIDAIYREAYGNEKTDLDRNSIITITEKIVKDNSNTLKYYIFF